jgi:periplasmic protein CpxP/Spy
MNTQMNVKVLLAAIALVLSTTATLPVFAQSGVPSVEQHARGKGNTLNLSADQKAKIKRIRDESREKIQVILTTEQKNQWTAAKQQGRKGKDIMQSLNLSETQKAQIREIKKAARVQMNLLLTPEQQQQIRQRRSPNPEV